MAMNPPEQPRVPAVSRAAAVLDAVSLSAHPMSLADLTRAVGLPKSSVVGICQSLVAERLLARGSDGSYALGPRIAELGAAAHIHRPLVRKVGLTVPSAANRFFHAELEGVQKEAAAMGAVVLDDEAGQDVQRQAAHITAFVSEPVDLIVVDPVSTEGLEEACARASRAGIPVVSINGATTGADAAVTTDNTEAGFLVGRHIAELLKGRGTVALVDGTRVTAVADRVAGFLSALHEYRGIHLVSHLAGDNTAATARKLVQTMLESGTRVEAFFGINDLTALGISQACSEAGLEVPVVGVDGSAPALDQIRRGGPIVATAAQDPYRLARAGVRLGVQLRSGIQPRQRTILLPTTLITPGQVHDYRSWDGEQ